MYSAQGTRVSDRKEGDFGVRRACKRDIKCLFVKSDEKKERNKGNKEKESYIQTKKH